MKRFHARMRLLVWRQPWLARLLQVLLLTGLCLVCNALAGALHLPVPGSVLALGLLLLMLLSGAMPLSTLRSGADWLLAEMLLFFIPAVMALWEHLPLLRLEGWRILLVILVGTVLVMLVTAALVDVVFRWRERHAR